MTTAASGRMLFGGRNYRSFRAGPSRSGRAPIADGSIDG
jgi:hypothetical protein